uniref:protein kintoun n=1 Tax=Doryrhamphus excisus TaxID=161450 RepID=UPI0025AE1DCC|nr:protein kintoun [Doryrhamphus excisus]
MDLGEKLKELNMSVDEIKSLTKAFKDEKFREMLRDYAEEIADPENRRIYEEEIAMLEQERGNNVEFVHPQPFRALKTSLNRKQKCYINICGNDKVGKPECKSGVSKEGRRGQCWSLPHNLTPGRQDTDPKGNKIMIYDVIFHPDTLHIANKNSKFMEMVSSTALKGIQDAFKVTLDENNMKELKTKYKGMPHPCVIRKPIPGFKPNDPAQDHPLAFPYPDEKPQKPSPDPKPRNYEIQHEKNTQPTEPSYSVKYRSFIDLQDFRCSRDSAKSPRPKEIIITIDVPLLKSVADVNLEVKEKNLLLESQTPAYKLELPLSYPVDEERGAAKFIKQKGQLTVTLPVLPSKEATEFFAQCADDHKGTDRDMEDGGKQMEGMESEVCDEEMKNEEEEPVKEDVIVEEEQLTEKLTNQKHVEKQQKEKLYEKERVEEVEGHLQEPGEQQEMSSQSEVSEEMKNEDEEPVKGDVIVEEEQLTEKLTNQKHVVEQQKEKLYEKERVEEHVQEPGEQQEMSSQSEVSEEMKNKDEEPVKEDVIVEEEQLTEKLTNQKHVEEQQKEKLYEKERVEEHVQEPGEQQEMSSQSEVSEDRSKDLVRNEDAPSSVEPSDVKDAQVDSCLDSQMTALSMQETATEKMERDTFQGSQTERSIEETSKMPTPSMGCSVSHPSGCTPLSAKDEKKSEPDKRHPPVFLKEIDKDGNVTVVSDHSTSAGFHFLNSLMYELD